MPKEIEDYVHRIGRTGRSGKTGVATTFINMGASEQILLDLKHLLKEAKQRIPPVLLAVDDPTEKYADIAAAGGCAFCSGLGHTVRDCEKYNNQRKKQMAALTGRKEVGGGEW